MILIVLLLLLCFGLGVDKRGKHGLRLDMIFYLDGHSLSPIVWLLTLSFFPSLLGRLLAHHIASSPQIRHELLYLLRRTDDFPTGLSLVHLPDHQLQFDDPALIDLAEEIDPGSVVAFEGGDGSAVLNLDDAAVAEQVVAGERAVNEVHPIRDANAAWG